MGQPSPPDALAPSTHGLKSQLLPDIRRAWTQGNYDRLQTYHKSRAEAEKLVINWLFTLTTGTLAGALTLVSSRGLNDYLLPSILCSGSGILCLIIRATWSYYRYEFKLYGAFKRDVDAFDADTLTGADLLQRDRDRAKGSHLLHLLGWLAGLLFLSAFVFGFLGLVKTSPKSSTVEYSNCVKRDARRFDFATAGG